MKKKIFHFFLLEKEAVIDNNFVLLYVANIKFCLLLKMKIGLDPPPPLGDNLFFLTTLPLIIFYDITYSIIHQFNFTTFPCL